MLTNLSYTRWNNNDFNKTTFTIDILTYFLQFLNLSGLDRKLETEDERNQVKFIWEECLPNEFLQYVLQEENYQVLGLLSLNYQKCYDIIQNFILQDLNHLPALIKAVKENLVVFWYVYATLFPKIYSRIDLDGIREKLSFEFKYHNWWNIQHYQQQRSPEQLQCANDSLDGNVEEVAISLAK